MGKGRGRGEGIRIRRRRQVKERKAVNEKFSTRGPAAAASRRFLGRVGGGLEFIDVEAIDSRNVSRARTTTTTTTNSKMIDRNNIVRKRDEERGRGAKN